MDLKRCPDCKETLPIASFGTQRICRTCMYSRVKRWRMENPDKVQEQIVRRQRKRRLMKNVDENKEVLEDIRFFE